MSLTRILGENVSDSYIGVTLEDIDEAHLLSLQIIMAASPARYGNIDELRRRRNLVGEYLRQGLEAIRTAAQFIHADNPNAMKRYPNLFARR